MNQSSRGSLPQLHHYICRVRIVRLDPFTATALPVPSIQRARVHLDLQHEPLPMRLYPKAEIMAGRDSILRTHRANLALDHIISWLALANPLPAGLLKRQTRLHRQPYPLAVAPVD
jgi:hypothetical protein